MFLFWLVFKQIHIKKDILFHYLFSEHALSNFIKQPVIEAQTLQHKETMWMEWYLNQCLSLLFYIMEYSVGVLLLSVFLWWCESNSLLTVQHDSNQNSTTILCPSCDPPPKLLVMIGAAQCILYTLFRKCVRGTYWKLLMNICTRCQLTIN